MDRSGIDSPNADFGIHQEKQKHKMKREIKNLIKISNNKHKCKVTLSLAL